MSNPWFRMYSEFAHDPKVQMLSEAMQRRYVMIMCMRCSNALVTLHETEIAFHLRISNDELAETKQLFVARGFIDDQWNVLNWEKRQFVSDSSAERVARHRKAKKEASNDDVTLHETKCNALDTDTDTDKNKIKTTPRKKRADEFDPADALSLLGVTEPVSRDFLSIRKKKRAPLTETALEDIKREAAKASLSLNDALEKCCARGWQGFEASWISNQKNAPSSNHFEGAI